MGRRSQAAEEDLQDADTVATAAPVVPGARGDARWRPAPAFPDGTCAGLHCWRFENAIRLHGASTARLSRRILRLVRSSCEAICFRAAERDRRRSAKPSFFCDDAKRDKPWRGTSPRARAGSGG